MQFLKITNKNRKKINKLLLCNFQNPYTYTYQNCYIHITMLTKKKMYNTYLIFVLNYCFIICFDSFNIKGINYIT